jgi:hypothetical protein
MQAGEITIGARVRYSRTGTIGNVVRIEEQKGARFAELDSTHLLYRVDQLTVTDGMEKKQKTRREDVVGQIEKEREYVAGSAYAEALAHTDQSCEGGG